MQGELWLEEQRRDGDGELSTSLPDVHLPCSRATGIIRSAHHGLLYLQAVILTQLSSDWLWSDHSTHAGSSGHEQTEVLLFNVSSSARCSKDLAVRVAMGAERAIMMAKTATCFKGPTSLSAMTLVTTIPFRDADDMGVTIRHFPKGYPHSLLYSCRCPRVFRPVPFHPSVFVHPFKFKLCHFCYVLSFVLSSSVFIFSHQASPTSTYSASRFSIFYQSLFRRHVLFVLPRKTHNLKMQFSTLALAALMSLASGT